MASIDEVLAAIPMDRLAAQLGVDPATAEQASRQALPALLGGMEANAQDPAGAASLGKAIGSHDAGLVEGGVDLDQVDTDDGDKIVGNVFGGQRDQVVNQLGNQGGGDSGLIAKLLPLLAPIVMSYLAKQMSSRSTQGGGTGGGGGLTDILGSVLGGGGGKGAGGLDLGSVLGGLLGGGKR
ncbi:MAG: DUF937 domain-containing protein [Solirubrobacteraceae bacterium]